DLIGLPYVGVHDAIDALELVEHPQRAPELRDGDATLGFEGLGIAEGEGVAAVAHHERPAIEADPPALAVVAVLRALGEGRAVPLVGDAVLPGDLKEPALDVGEALAEAVGQMLDAAHLARRELDLAEAALADEACALVDHAVRDEEPLREGSAVVGMLGDDAHLERGRDGRGEPARLRLDLLGQLGGRRMRRCRHAEADDGEEPGGSEPHATRRCPCPGLRGGLATGLRLALLRHGRTLRSPRRGRYAGCPILDASGWPRYRENATCPHCPSPPSSSAPETRGRRTACVRPGPRWTSRRWCTTWASSARSCRTGAS